MVDGQPDNYVTCHVTKNRFGPTSETTLLMTSAGYDWNYSPPPPVESNTKPVTPKSQRKEQEMKTVMELAAKKNIVKLLHAEKALKQTSQRAAYILRELVLKGKLSKEGRGKNATYKKN